MKIKEIKEKFIEFANDEYGMVIVAAWFWLIVCLIIRLLGGNWFELSTENERFLMICEFVDNTMWLKMFLACLISLITSIPFLCIVLNEKRLSKKNAIIFVPILILKSVLSWYNSVISFVLDLIILLGITTIINKNFKRSVCCLLVMVILQTLTLTLRSLGVGFDFNITYSFVVQSLYQIDYFAMIMLFYAYNFRRKEKK